MGEALLGGHHLGVGIGLELQQAADAVDVAVAAGELERRLPVAAHGRVNLPQLAGEDVDDGAVLRGVGVLERPETDIAQGDDEGARAHEQLHHGQVAALHRVAQRRGAAAVGHVAAPVAAHAGDLVALQHVRRGFQVGAQVDELAGKVGVVVGGGPQQGGAAVIGDVGAQQRLPQNVAEVAVRAHQPADISLVEERLGEQQQQLGRQCEQADCRGHGDDVGWRLLGDYSTLRSGGCCCCCPAVSDYLKCSTLR